MAELVSRFNFNNRNRAWEPHSDVSFYSIFRNKRTTAICMGSFEMIESRRMRCCYWPVGPMWQRMQLASRQRHYLKPQIHLTPLVHEHQHALYMWNCIIDLCPYLYPSIYLPFIALNCSLSTNFCLYRILSHKRNLHHTVPCFLLLSFLPNKHFLPRFFWRWQIF